MSSSYCASGILNKYLFETWNMEIKKLMHLKHFDMCCHRNTLHVSGHISTNTDPIDLVLSIFESPMHIQWGGWKTFDFRRNPSPREITGGTWPNTRISPKFERTASFISINRCTKGHINLHINQAQCPAAIVQVVYWINIYLRPGTWK